MSRFEVGKSYECVDGCLNPITVIKSKARAVKGGAK